MDIDLSAQGINSAVFYGVNTKTVPTTVGNVLPVFDSIAKVYAPEKTRDISITTDPSIEGFLRGRRPSYGQLYPRSEHVPALDLKGYASDSVGIPPGVIGYIFSAVSYTQTPTVTSLDPNDTSAGTYMDNFGLILPYQPNPPLFRYNQTRNPVTIESGVFDYFNIDWVLRFNAYNACWDADYCNVTIEFLDQVDSVIAILKTVKDSNPYRHRVEYGVSSSSLTMATQVGPYPNTTGDITFTDNSIVYTNIRSTNYNDSFTINCPAYLIRKIRISNLYVDSSWTGGLCSAGVDLRIV